MKHYKSWSFYEIYECPAPMNKRKAPYWKLSGDGSGFAILNVFRKIDAVSIQPFVYLNLFFTDYDSFTEVTAAAVFCSYVKLCLMIKIVEKRRLMIVLIFLHFVWKKIHLLKKYWKWFLNYVWDLWRVCQCGLAKDRTIGEKGLR